MALISFIIPYHDEPLWMLRECLESILALDLEAGEREIIVVDDGSRVSPLEEISAIGSDITYLRQENRGLSGARNHGISAATGEYIQFVDSDDCLLPPYNGILQLLRTRKPDVLQFMFTREKGHYGGTPYKIVFDGSADERLSKYNLRVAACLYLFRREALGSLRFKDGIYHEDELFTPQLLLQARTLIDTDAKAYFYRKREESITTTTDALKIAKRLDDIRDIIVELHETMENDARKVLQRKVLTLTMDYLYNSLTLTHSLSEYKKRRQELKTLRLLPLPLCPISWKYYLFACFSRIV